LAVARADLTAGAPGQVSLFSHPLWQLVAGGDALLIQGHSAGIRAVVFTPDAKRLLTASDDGTIKVWGVKTGQELLTLKAHQAEVTGLAFDPTGRRLASCSVDGTVKLWEAAAAPK
jgi:WD40 repeat protein